MQGIPISKPQISISWLKREDGFPIPYVMGGHHRAICIPSRTILMSGKSLFHVYDKLEGVTTMPMLFA
nr:hypothetical protein [Sunxiuqinia sp.]